MSNKKGLTLEQHQKLGKELYDMSQRLETLGYDLDKAYNKKTASFAFNAHRTILELRSQLDTHVFLENRSRSTNENAGVYYCGSEQH